MIEKKPQPIGNNATTLDSKMTARSQQWATIRVMLHREFGDRIYNHWLKGMDLVASETGKTVQLKVASDFTKRWILNHYAERLTYFWRRHCPEIDQVEIVVDSDMAKDAKISEGDRLAAKPAKSSAYGLRGQFGKAGDKKPDAVDMTQLHLDKRFTFDAFVVGKENELAFAAARRVAESVTVPFNPLFLYGGVGLGKTHLMHAIAWHIVNNQPRRRVFYMSAEKFMYQFIRAVRFKDTVEFKEQFRSVDVLMIDDVQFISGRNATQEEFFHTFNALVDGKRQVVISADKSPGDLEGIEERLRSRLGWGLVADIHPAAYELRLGILQEKASTLSVPVPQKVLEFLAHRITSNVRVLEGALNKITVHAELSGTPVTLPAAQAVLQDLLRTTSRRVRVDDIQKRVCEYFGIRLPEMFSSRRAQAVARPRQVAMYLAKQLTPCSLPDIGRRFGNRDHTTVMHAIRRIESLRAKDRSFDEDIDLLRRQLDG